MTSRLILATGNQGKASEVRAMLPAAIEVVTAAELGSELPEETGSTFSENAAIKALALSRLHAGLVLADDSGLEVDALQGRPGVRSARYAGEPSDDAANVAILLTELAGMPGDLRAARFVCALCLAQNGEVIAEVQGVSEGSIAKVPRGVFGFGYDPVFLVADGRTMAELTPGEKNASSHRGRALGQIIPTILSVTDHE